MRTCSTDEAGVEVQGGRLVMYKGLLYAGIVEGVVFTIENRQLTKRIASATCEFSYCIGTATTV